MADNEQNNPELKPPPSHFKSKVWAHFGFFALKGKGDLDMSKAVCRLRHAHIAYCGNTTNVTAHLARHHPELMTQRRPAAKQQTLKSALFKLPSSSEKAKRITKSIADFICKDLQPFSVVDNMGFRNMLHTLEPRYVIPSRKYFSGTAVPQIYMEVKEKEKLSRACHQSWWLNGTSQRRTQL